MEAVLFENKTTIDDNWIGDGNWTGNVTDLLITTLAPTKRPIPRLLPHMLLTYKVADKLYPISSFVLFILGTIGNLLSLAVLSKKGMRVLTSSVYLRALAVSDQLTIWANMMVAIAKFYEMHLNTKWFCKIFFWFQSSFQQISSYLVIAMTAERFFAVAFPLSVGRIFTKKVAYIISALVYICFLALNVPYVVMTLTFRKLICIFDRQNYGDLLNVWTKVDSSIAAYIPAILILILNVLIIVQVKKAKSSQKALKGGKEDTKGAKSQDQAAQITRMLLTISIAYWVLNMPMAIFFAANEYFFDFMNVYDYANSYLTQQICFFLMVTNNSINFYLYCLTGKRFRHELKNLVLCRDTPPMASRTTSSTMSTAVGGNTKMVSMSQINVTEAKQSKIDSPE